MLTGYVQDLQTLLRGEGGQLTQRIEPVQVFRLVWNGQAFGQSSRMGSWRRSSASMGTSGPAQPVDVSKYCMALLRQPKLPVAGGRS